MMRTLHTFLIATSVLTWAVLPAGAGVEVGSSRQDVIDTLGQPEFKFTRSGTEFYNYYGLELELQDGKVTKVPFGLSQEIAKRQGVRKDELDRQAALAKRAGTQPRVVKQPTRKSAGSHGGSVKVIANGGKQVDVKRYVGRGKVTIVDFYADWCGPCRQVAPHLEKLANGDNDVNLVKIDIVNWKTPVVSQYKVKSVPNMRVYDRNGTMVGSATSDIRKVAKYVQKAK